MEFRDWARAKYDEILSSLNPCDDSGEIDPVKLNDVLVNFPTNLAWAITISEIETNELNKLQHDFDRWNARMHSRSYRKIMEERGDELGKRVPRS